MNNMYGIRCNVDGLRGFVTGSFIHQGNRYVSVTRIDSGKRSVLGFPNIHKIKVYKSEKTAANAIRDYENAFKEDFEVVKFTDKELRTLERCKKNNKQ
ncbi:hypothetical protein [Enterococcus sp. LJL51]|uniref:hypothetical protein n=1 Tax=Enterococcus sp. LJL51 TaxID=3416656 RepID=UPI003CF5FF6F